MNKEDQKKFVFELGNRPQYLYMYTGTQDRKFSISFNLSFFLAFHFIKIVKLQEELMRQQLLISQTKVGFKGEKDTNKLHFCARVRMRKNMYYICIYNAFTLSTT